jgi:hypothetical protein
VRQLTAEAHDYLTQPDPASTALRLTYFEPRVAEALYGLEHASVRWHRDVRARLGRAELRAVEILRAPFSGSTTAFAVLHVTLPEDPLSTLFALARSSTHDDPATGRPALAQLLPAGTGITEGRANTIAHLTFTDAPTVVMPQPYDHWPADRQWLWLTASATPLDGFPPDAEDASLFEGLVRLSADWRALVLRDGVAFVGLTADPGGDATFHAIAQTYVHSIYLDVALLGRMQVGALQELSNQIAGIRISTNRPPTLSALERRLMEIRRVLWSRHVTLHGRGNDLLDRYQAQHRLPELLQHVVADLTDASRVVETATTRSVNAALGLLTVLGLPFGLAYAAGAVLAEHSLLLFGVCTATAAVIASVLLIAFPPLRRMVGALRAVRVPVTSSAQVRHPRS